MAKASSQAFEKFLRFFHDVEDTRVHVEASGYGYYGPDILLTIFASPSELWDIVFDPHDKEQQFVGERFLWRETVKDESFLDRATYFWRPMNRKADALPDAWLIPKTARGRLSRTPADKHHRLFRCLKTLRKYNVPHRIHHSRHGILLTILASVDEYWMAYFYEDGRLRAEQFVSKEWVDGDEALDRVLDACRRQKKPRHRKATPGVRRARIRKKS